MQCSNNFPTTLSIMYLWRFLSYLSTLWFGLLICFPVKRWISIWRHNLFLIEKIGNVLENHSNKWRTNISKVPEEWGRFQFRKQNKRLLILASKKILLLTNAQKISCLIHNDNGKFEACDSIFFIFADHQMEMKFLFKGSLISEGYLL